MTATTNDEKDKAIEFETKQTRFEIYDYINNRAKAYPEIFQDSRLHIYFTEDLITLEEAKKALSTQAREFNLERAKLMEALSWCIGYIDGAGAFGNIRTDVIPKAFRDLVERLK